MPTELIGRPWGGGGGQKRKVGKMGKRLFDAKVLLLSEKVEEN